MSNVPLRPITEVLKDCLTWDMVLVGEYRIVNADTGHEIQRRWDAYGPLLEACERTLNFLLCSGHGASHVADALEEAIAKARGATKN